MNKTEIRNIKEGKDSYSIGSCMECKYCEIKNNKYFCNKKNKLTYNYSYCNNFIERKKTLPLIINHKKEALEELKDKIIKELLSNLKENPKDTKIVHNIFISLANSKDLIKQDNILNEIKKITGNKKSTLEKQLKVIKFKANSNKALLKEGIKYKKYTLEECKSKIKKWLSINDDDWLDVIFACSLDRKIKGEPIWLFIIGVPSSTKTEILFGFVEGKDFYHLSNLTVNSFVSGYVKPDGEKVEDMAEQLNEKILILKDFTSVLSMPKEKRNDIIGQLREFYDGSYDKKFGNLDKKVTSKSKFGLLAGVTPKIDQFGSVMGELGERFLKLRSNFNEDDMLDLCERNDGKEEIMRNEVKEAIMGFITNLDIKDIIFEKEHITQLREFSKYIAKLRAPAFNRWEGDSIVCDIPPQPEKPTRVYKQLKKLTKALCNIYCVDKCNKDILKKVERVSKDSVPQDRQSVYAYVLKKGMVTESQISKDLNIPRTSLKRILDILKRLKLLDGDLVGSSMNNNWSAKKIEGDRVGIKSGRPYPNNIQRVSPPLPDTEEIKMGRKNEK